MKTAILGGGISGLTTAYYLKNKNNQVVIFEKENQLGGLASSFKVPGWKWSVDRTYHHLFSNDDDVLEFAKEIGFEDVFFRSPQTASLYETVDFKNKRSKEQLNNLTIHPLDTPIDFLRFPYLNLFDKIRTGLVLAFLKFSPFLSVYEEQTGEQFLKSTMGERSWNVLWKELFRKKFNKNAGKIISTFIWARIKKRTKKLGYIKKGFQNLVDYLEEINKTKGVEIKKRAIIFEIRKKNNQFEVKYKNSQGVIEKEMFDVIVSTLPTPVLTKTTQSLFPTLYLDRLKKIKYFYAFNLIVESKKAFLEKTYWLNVCIKRFPFTGIIEQTNFIDKKHYGNSHFIYLVNYVDPKDKRLKMTGKELLNDYLPYLKKINPDFKPKSFYLLKAPYAQPVVDKEFLKNKPDFTTPIKNFYIANLDMTYPYERGVNYAVKIGKKVSKIILKA